MNDKTKYLSIFNVSRNNRSFGRLGLQMAHAALTGDGKHRRQDKKRRENNNNRKAALTLGRRRLFLWRGHSIGALMVWLSSQWAALFALHITFYVGFAVFRNSYVAVPIFEAVVLCLLLVWISMVDLDRFEIPDLAAGLLAASGIAFIWGSDPTILIRQMLAGIIWSGLFWAVGIAYLRWRGWHGLGFGDVKLMFGIAVWVGFTGATIVVFAAAMAGIVSIIALKWKNSQSFDDLGTTGVAFGPYLCLSTWVVWLFRGSM